MFSYLRWLLIGLTVTLGLPCCSSSGPISGASDSKGQSNVKKSGARADGDENADADFPQEVSGAFLTCSYVPEDVASFPPSSDHVPIGCVVEKDNAKVGENDFKFNIKLYSPDYSLETLTTKAAPASSKWHGYAHLPRTGKSHHSLGMLITDKRTNVVHGPLLFAVADIESDSPAATYNLVGGYVPTGGLEVSRVTPGGSPFIPSLLCKDGVMPDTFEASKLPNAMSRLGIQFGTVLSDLGVLPSGLIPKMDLSSTRKSVRPMRTVSCFELANEASNDASQASVRKQPVIEANGCLFLQSKESYVVVIEQKTIEEFNIKKEYLEEYVKTRLCH